MIRVMNMTTGNIGKIIEDEFGSFEDEVLGAGWLPPVPELQLGLQEVRVETTAASKARNACNNSELDADTFLSKVYRHQA